MDSSSTTPSHTSWHRRPRRPPPPPPISQPPSTSFSASFSHSSWRPGRSPVPRASPFASDDDRSWQGDISWQARSRGFHENRNLGAALSPWTASEASTPTTYGSRIFKRSANHYYLSNTSGGVSSFINPYYENSCTGYDAVPSGRLELQSFESGEHNIKPHYVSRQDRIKEGPSAGKVIDYENEVNQYHHDHEMVNDHHHMGYTNHSHHLEQHRIHDGVDGYDVKCVDSHHVDHHRSGQSNIHQYRVESKYSESDGSSVSDEEKDEAEVKPPKPVPLLSLFKYSTTLDLILVVLGCIGALINGGSLPWYSYLFGDFVNKIALDTDKDQMMKDVRKV